MKTNAVDTLILMIDAARRGRNRRRAAEAKPAAPLRARNAILPAAAVAAMLQACTPAQVQPTSDRSDAYPVAQAEANPVMQEPPEASAAAPVEAPRPEPVLVASTEPVPVLAANPVPAREAASGSEGKEAATKPAPAEKTAAIAERQAEAKPTKPAAAAAPEREAAPKLKVDADFASYRGLVGFASGSETLGPIGRAEVEAMIPPAMKAEAIALRGRTGAVKASEQMRKLAVGRGVAVRRVFVEHGVDKAKIQIFVKEGGFGDYLHPEDPRSPENRRVEVEMKMPDGVVLRPSK